jgi:hypothetical protein
MGQQPTGTGTRTAKAPNIVSGQPRGPGFDSSVAGTDIRPATAARKRSAHDQLFPKERHERIAEAAYFRAQARGFAPGAELDDWLSAEDSLER